MSASVSQRETKTCIAARHVPECLSRKAFILVFLSKVSEVATELRKSFTT